MNLNMQPPKEPIDQGPEEMPSAKWLMGLGVWIPRLCGLAFLLMIFSISFFALNSYQAGAQEDNSTSPVAEHYNPEHDYIVVFLGGDRASADELPDLRELIPQLEQKLNAKASFIMGPAPERRIIERLFDQSAQATHEDSNRLKEEANKSEQVRAEQHALEKRRLELEIQKAERDTYADENIIYAWIDRKMPATLKQTVLDIKYWQILAVLISIILGMMVDLLVRVLFRKITSSIIEKKDMPHHAKAIKNVVRPLGLGAAALIWVGTLPIIGLSGLPLDIVQGAAKIFATLAWVWAIWRMVDLLGDVMMERAKMTATRIDDVVVPLLRKSLKIFIVIMGVVYVASALNFDITPLIASIGIGSLGFAFAAKDTIENFFGSITVLIDRPFEVGDWVVIDGEEGTVEQIGFRSTRIRTFYNSQITLPNAMLVRAAVDNMGRREYRRTKCYIGVQYDTPTEKLIAFREGIHELVRNHPHTRKDYYQVWFNQFGPSSLDILIYVFFKVGDWTMELREKERFFLDIKRLAEELGVEFAFPTQTLHMYQHDGQTSHMPPPAPQKDTDGKAMVDGISAAQRVIDQQPWRDRIPGSHEFKGRTDLSEFETDQAEMQSEDIIGPAPIPKDATGGA